jgi:hypothetical protein
VSGVDYREAIEEVLRGSISDANIKFVDVRNAAAGRIDEVIGEMIDDHQNGDFREGIIVARARTNTIWFQHAASESQAVCFPLESGDAIFYLGNNRGAFQNAFYDIGVIF